MNLGKLAAHLAPKKKHLQFLQSKLKLNGLETRHRFRCLLATPKNDAPLSLRGVRDDYKKHSYEQYKLDTHARHNTTKRRATPNAHQHWCVFSVLRQKLGPSCINR